MCEHAELHELMIAKFSDAPSGAYHIMEMLEEAGYPTYFVGGCVRDAIMGTAPHDYDLTTLASPSEMIATLPYEHFDAGLKHGTLSFITGDDERDVIEVTMFRTETGYSDGRHPDTIEKADTIEDDLARRDFTINAMAWSPTRGLVDPYGGAEDIKERRIRCVGDPYKRFEEDGLRVMRLLRFAATKRLTPDSETLEAARDCAKLLRHVSAERISSELLKALGGRDSVYVALAFRKMPEVMMEVLPELRAEEEYDQLSIYHDRDLLTHSLDALACVDKADPILRLAALLHDCGKPDVAIMDKTGHRHYHGHAERGAEIAAGIADRLRFTIRDKKRLVSLIAGHEKRPTGGAKAIRRFVSRCGGYEEALDMLILMIADVESHAVDYRDPMYLYDAYRAVLAMRDSDDCAVRVTDLVISGNDLISLGYTPGKELGAELRRLHSLVLDGEIDNERGALLAAVRSA